MEKRLFDLGIGKGHELLLALQNAGLTAKQAEFVIDNPKLTEIWVAKLLSIQPPVDRFAQYAHLLRPLSTQAMNLRYLNENVPKNMRVPDSCFNNLDTNSDHIQMIEDLEFFLAVPSGALKKVIEYQVKLVELTQLAIWHSSDFDSEIESAYLDETADKGIFAKPSIYRLRINLAAYWDPKNGSSVDQARQHALANGVKLAGLAAIGAYAVQDSELYRSQDGENLPYFDIADLKSGDGGSRAFYSFWFRGGREVCFNSCGSDFVNWDYARPSFI